jgi:hypothetical protein
MEWEKDYEEAVGQYWTATCEPCCEVYDSFPGSDREVIPR